MVAGRAADRILTPFDAGSTAAEVVAGTDLGGRRAVVTGGSSGIGVETARALAGVGAAVTLAVRDVAAGERVAADLVAATGNPDVAVAPLDLADQASVRALAAAWTGPLHILVNNAGVMACPLGRTAEGWERQFATNHLGHFALTVGLRGALAAAGGGARVVVVSSAAHLRQAVHFDDIHFNAREYNPWMAYGQSKTANVLFAVELTRRWADDGITANALHPGIIATNLGRHLSREELKRISIGAAAAVAASRGGQPGGAASGGASGGTGGEAPTGGEGARRPGGPKSPAQGAATSALLAASPLVEGVGGRYFEDCNEAEPVGRDGRLGVAAHALDPEAATRLWEASTVMIGS
ncbi:SDR family NAD(P)-dependent oxidoreductase [Frankia nepalensis]|uniref:SDR family NAD(P)-dependent oxidoreductase n=1 Tax=Frankia nepalensis TaxID=1836974 RepID=A0A937RFH7_9ACTN|nr:SDR family NAD(P)-dependent oxidoreductase [Frankia nepalensis]MBL7501778.1 SDR family NAD(P)-dependent oxidoreductase [Frankia nepalensis]MBL7515165.1 SDR family NAD(P)-dependent oxidoreductase [Frankia nepalensis]MBL7629242.1 SDR family NAD(P)-dependent oxidoreductase [Frankia nepalensis]